MVDIVPLSLDYLLLITGLVILLLAYLLVRFKSRDKPNKSEQYSYQINVDIPTNKNALIVVEPGGKIAYINNRARKFFAFIKGLPNLDQLSYQISPKDSFLRLCSTEGKARFSINNQIVEGTSYSLPLNGKKAMIVTLNPRQNDTFPIEDEDRSDQVIEIIDELTQAITSDFDVDSTLIAILKSVAQRIPYDISIISLWNVNTQSLSSFIYHGWVDKPWKLEIYNRNYIEDNSYIEHLISQNEPLLISDVKKYRDIRPDIDRKKYPYQSYIGLPLFISDKLIGTLEFFSFSAQAFTNPDASILRSISNTAAIAINNALVYRDEKRRTIELSSLASLSRAIGSVDDSIDLYAKLVESITPLLDVEIVGFLVFNKAQRRIEAQWPFKGLPENFIDLYQVPIPMDSPAEEIWLSKEPIISNDAQKDQRVKGLGLDHAARAAGIRKTALIPMKSSGRILGYLQAANKQDGTEFNQEDIRLMDIIAGQAAPIIENAELVHQTVQKAMRADALRRITSLASSNANLDETFKYSLQELARLAHADLGLLFIREHGKDVFSLHRNSLFGTPPVPEAEIYKLPQSIHHDSKRMDKSRSFISGNVSLDDRISGKYRLWLSNLKSNSLIDVPIIVSSHDYYARILLTSNESDFFSENDVLLAITVADQIASSIERSKLASQTDEDLRRRVEHLTAFTHISRELNSSLNLEYLLQKVFETSIQLTNADCGTIVLFELGETKPVYPRIMLHLGDPPAEELHPLESAVLKDGEPMIIRDFLDSDEIDSQIEPFHKDIRSALITPIAYQENVAGLIHLHAIEPNRFDQTAIEITQTLSIQAAIALGNAQRYQDQIEKNILLSRRVEALNELFETSRSLNLEKPIEQTLEDIAVGIQRATPFNVILISTFNVEDNSLHRITGAGLTLDALSELRAHKQNWDRLNDLLKPEFRYGRSYFIPHERMPVLPENIHTLTVLPNENPTDEHDNAWHPEDALLVPLENAKGEPLGLISVDAPRDGIRPDIPTIETLEIFASQAVLTIESHQRIGKLRKEIAKINKDLKEQQQNNQEKNEQLKNLAQIELEANTILDNTKILVERMNGVMAIVADLVNQTDRTSALKSLGYGFQQYLELDSVLIAESRLDGPHLIEIFGEVPKNQNLDALVGQRNPIIDCIKTDENLLVAEISEVDDWQQSPLIRALSAKGFIALAISPRTERTIVVLGISRSPLARFSKDEEELFHHLSQQTSSILQNIKNIKNAEAKLREVNLLLDFSQILENLDASSILETMVENILKIIPGADAAMAALWDHVDGHLFPRASSGYANSADLLNMRIQKGEAVPGRVFELGESVRIDEIIFTRDYDFSKDNLLLYRDATGGNISISTLCVPIRSNDQTIGVLLIENHHISRAFTQEDQFTVNSIAQLTALMLDYEKIYKTTHKRATQLQVLTNLSTAMSASLHPNELTHTLLDKLEVILPYHTGTLWMIEDEKLTIHSTRGFNDQEKLIGVTTNIEDSELMRFMIDSGTGMCVGDMASDPRFPSLEQRICHSWLGVPMISKDKVIGVIALEHRQKNFYSEDHLHFGSIFAVQAAIAIENARLYQSSQLNAKELDKRSQHLKRIYQFAKEVGSSLNLNQILQITISELDQIITADNISIIFLDEASNVKSSKISLNLVAEKPKIEDKLPHPIPYAPIFSRLMESYGVFITSDISNEEGLAPLNEFFKVRGTRSLLILPLVAGNKLLGYILIQTVNKYPFTSDELDTARVITNHSTIALQNALVYENTSRLKLDLEKRIEERTRQLRSEHQRAQALLRIIKELSTSLDIDQVLNRTLALLNETIEAEQSSILLVQPDESTFVFRATLKGDKFQSRTDRKIPPHPHDEALARWAIKNRRGDTIANIHQDPRWINQIDQDEKFHSAIVVPLVVRDETLGSIQLYHHQIDWFSQDHFEFVQGAANQIAVSINNAALFNLIREQAEELGTSLRNQQVEAGRSRAILEAVADGVIVTDDAGEITLFNSSAEKILGLDSSEALRKSLDLFIGLFSSASNTWIETIRNWSNDPSTYQAEETYEEHIILDNNKVVAVHLAPVIIDDEFFGTVSIFRDITHMIEVDRLKSDFVAQVSHELRTPMTSIKGYVDLMLMGATGELSVQQDQFLQIVKSNTERLNVLVNDLLDISRIETGRITLTMQALNLLDLAEGMASSIRKRSKEDDKQINVKIDIHRDVSLVLGDRELVQQIFNNIITNAYNYTPAGGKIKIWVQENSEHVQVNIQDNGIGIPPEEQKNVFERFYRGENPTVLATAGTGLGLSIAKRLVELHKGEIWVESSGIQGEGSTFSFTLPILDQHHGE